MELCEHLITACLGESCDHIPTPGIEQTAWIFNKKDIKDFHWDPDRPNTSTQIELKDDAIGYQIYNVGQAFSGTQSEATVDDYGTSWTDTFVFAAPKGIANSLQIDEIANGKFVVVIETSYEGEDGDAQYQILGAKHGLKLSAGTLDPYSDSKGRYSITLTAENEPRSARYLQHVDGDSKIDTLDHLNEITSCEPEPEPEPEPGE